MLISPKLNCKFLNLSLNKIGITLCSSYLSTYSNDSVFKITTNPYEARGISYIIGDSAFPRGAVINCSTVLTELHLGRKEGDKKNPKQTKQNKKTSVPFSDKIINSRKGLESESRFSLVVLLSETGSHCVA